MRIKEKIGEIQITPKNKIIINILEFQSKNKLDIRSWFLNPEGEWIATRRGIAFDIKLTDRLIRLLSLIDVNNIIDTQRK